MASPLTEEFRRAALALAAAGRQSRYQAAIVSSATRGEGTTSAVVQLGRHMMKDAGLKPVIVELNRTRPALERLFNLDGRRTLASLMSGGGSALACVQNDRTGLAMIPAGRFDDTESSPASFETVLCRAIRELQGAYDFILVDAAPILESADVLIAGRVIPQLVLVVGAGQVSQENLNRSCQQLQDAHIELAGTILVARRRIVPRWIEKLLG